MAVGVGKTWEHMQAGQDRREAYGTWRVRSRLKSTTSVGGRRMMAQPFPTPGNFDDFFRW